MLPLGSDHLDSDLLMELSRTIRRHTSAVMQLSRLPDEPEPVTVSLDFLVVPEKKRRRGNGRRAMQLLCETADQHQWELRLIVDGFWGTPEPVLCSFYRDFDFRRVASVPYLKMVRPSISSRTTACPTLLAV